MVVGSRLEGLAHRVESLLGRSPLSYLAPLIIGILPLVWLLPSHTYLYGQDSLNLINPFGFNHNPFVPYSYLYSEAFPIPDNQPYFYTYAALFLFYHLGLDYAAAERLLLLLSSILGVAGIYRTFTTINLVLGRSPESNAIAKAAGAVFYLVNPFSLTIIWWHFQNWDYFVLGLPFLLAILLRVYYLGRVGLAEFAGTALVLALLGPGLNGPFAVGVAYTFAFFIAALVWKTATEGIRRADFLSRLGTMLSLALLAVGPVLLPYLLISDVPLTTSNYVTSANLVQQFYSQTSTATLLNTVRLLGFSWIYNVPDAYAWTGLLPIISLAAFAIPALLLLAVLRWRRAPGLLLLVVWILPVIVVSTGATPPFGWLNIRLLEIGGPFLVVDNAYDIVGCMLPVFFAIIVFYSLAEGSRKPGDEPVVLVPRRMPVVSGEDNRIHYPRNGPSGTRARSWQLGGPGSRRVTRVAVCLLIVTLLVVVAIPFASGEVFQTKGNNVDSFEVPPSFFTLESYFSQNYTGPVYQVLTWPMSSGQGTWMSFGNASFVDSSSLLSSFIPYPLLSTDTGPVAAAVDSLIVSGSYQSLALPLLELHVKYIVVNPYYDPTSYYMTHDATGAIDNLTRDLSAFTWLFGRPLKVGTFLVFVNEGVSPLVQAEAQLADFVEPTFASYLSALAQFNETNMTLRSVLSGSTYSPSPISGSNVIRVVAVGPIETQADVAPGGTAALFNTSGMQIPQNEYSSLPGVSYNRSSGSLTVLSPVIAQFSPENSSVSGFEFVNGTFVSSDNRTASIQLNESVNGTTVLTSSVSIRSLSTSSWFDIRALAGPITVWTEVYINTSTETANLGMFIENGSSRFAWSNVALPYSPTAESFNLIVVIGNTSAQSTLSFPGSSATFSNGLLYGTHSRIESNPGFNTSLMPTGSIVLGSYQVGLLVTDVTAAVTAPTLLMKSSVGQILLLSTQAAPPAVPCEVETTDSGNFLATFAPAPNSTYLELVLPFSALWSATSSVGSIMALGNQSQLNLFLLSTGGSRALTGVTVTIQFGTYLVQALSVSIASTIVLGATVILTRFGRIRWKSPFKSRA